MCTMALALTSCSDNPSIADIDSNDAIAGRTIGVHLLCLADGMEFGGGTADVTEGKTRALDNPDNVDDTKIKTLWVLQYANTSDTARMQGSGALRPILDYNPKDYWTGDSTIRLVQTGKEPCRLVFLANYDPSLFEESRDALHSGARYNALRNAVKHNITKEDDLFYKDSLGNTYFPLAGEWTGTITSNTIKDTIRLKHTVAQININIDNNTYGKDTIVDLAGIALRNVPAYHYLYHPSDDYTDIDSINEIYSSVNLSMGLPTSAHQRFSYTWYMPANGQGTIDNDYEVLKNLYCPNKKHSTMLIVAGTYRTRSSEYRNYFMYEFYLGKNMTNDFNILDNHRYTYNITINGLTDPAVDSRMKNTWVVSE